VIWRSWEWWRERRRLVDFAFMLPIMVVTWLTLDIRDPRYWTSHDGRVVGFAVLVAGPLIWRRSYPRTVFALVSLASFLQWTAHLQFQWANLAVLMGLYTLAADCSFRWGVAAAVVTEFGGVIEVLQQWETSGVKEQRNAILAFSAVACGVWVLGIYTHTRREYLRGLEEKAARLERERDTQVRMAMTAERARIARELHDVVAHNVSVIVVQADGAGFAIDSDPERAKRALETISTTGRQALTEMRRLLGVLREGGEHAAGGPEPYTPQPSLDQLNELVSQVRASGLALEMEVEGVPCPLQAGLQLTLFRIVQEALTNTLKHAGPTARARVMLQYGDTAIRVTVEDDGMGKAAADDGLGHGLMGMRERAAMYGGTVDAGPRPGGGFRVAAELPLREGARA
jgi:signal transduction histidine kinase